MVFRDCNSIILNDFISLFESKTWNCVLYGDFYGEKMCPSTQRKSSIRAVAWYSEAPWYFEALVKLTMDIHLAWYSEAPWYSEATPIL